MVLPSTRLSAIRWSLSKVPELEENQVMTNSHFEDGGVAEGTKALVPLDTNVGSLVEDQLKSLCLVVGN